MSDFHNFCGVRWCAPTHLNRFSIICASLYQGRSAYSDAALLGHGARLAVAFERDHHRHISLTTGVAV